MMTVLSGLSSVRLWVVPSAAEAATVNQNRDNFSPSHNISNTTTGELESQDEDLFVYLPIIVGQSAPVGPNQVRYVATTGNNVANSCTDPNNPCLTVQHAVDVTIPGDEIRVAAGTYAGVAHRIGTNQTAYLFKPLTIRGGFTTTDWSTPDPAAHVTILDAQGQGRVFKITGPISVTIEGLLLTGGNGSGGSGGGVYADSATITFRDNRILTNTALIGGGLFLTSSQARFERNVIAGNATTNSGGGVVIGPASEVRFINNFVTNNQTNGHGGGLILSGTLAALTNTMITDNQAGLDGSGLFIENSAAELWHTTISNNPGPGSGVALDSSTAALTNTILVSHTVGISASVGSTATLEATVWSGNATKWSGPGTINIGSYNFIGELRFVDPGGGNYHLDSSTSIASNRGVDTNVMFDIDDEIRPWAGIPDLGADERFYICPPDCGSGRNPIIIWIEDEFGDMTEPAGSNITIMVEAHLPNTLHVLRFGNDSVSFTTDNLGKATINYTIPESILPGVYPIYTAFATSPSTPEAFCLGYASGNVPCFTVTSN
jgi:hypothetical protein